MGLWESTGDFNGRDACVMLQRRLLQFYSLSKKFQHHFSASQKRHFSSLTLKDIRESPANSNVLAHGWIKSIRRHKNVTFAAINDGSSIKETQLVISPSQAEGYRSPGLNNYGS